MEQGSVEWHAFRASHIGASDAPIIMEVSPWKNPEQLWKEKMGISISPPSNINMSRGLELEPLARRKFEEMTGLYVEPSVKVSKKYPWMSASLDGIDFDEKNIVEIKCANKKDHELASRSIVPEKYYPQLQHQMEVCEVEHAYYFSFNGKDGIVFAVKRDQNYINLLIEKEEAFWECLQSKTPPQPAIQLIRHPEWEQAAKEWKSLQPLLKRERELRDLLIGYSNGMNSKGAGLSLTKGIRKGAIDYSLIPELENMDVEKYRKKDIEVWTIKEV